LFRGDRASNGSRSFALLFSIACGFGIACKLNFIPVVFIPLILFNSIRQRLTFVILTVMFFLLFAFPVIQNYEYFGNWVKNIFVHNSIYGQGDPNVINTSSFFKNIIKILTLNYTFGIIYLLSFLVLIYHFLNSGKAMPTETSTQMSNEIRILAGLVLPFSIQILIVAKHYHPYTQKYMIPAFMLSVTSFIICIRICCHYFKLQRVRTVYAVSLIVILLWNVLQFNKVADLLSFQKNESIRAEDYLKEHYSENFVIPDLESSNQEKALAFTIHYAGSQRERYSDILSKCLHLTCITANGQIG